MFELLEGNSEVTKIVAVGVGTVGCKILSSSLNKVENEVKTIFIHSNEKFLSGLGVNDQNTILLSTSTDIPRINTPRDALLALTKRSSQLEEFLSNSDIVFVIAGLGGATGSGCSPFITQHIEKRDALCIGMFSLPFDFEGRGKRGAALSAYSKLKNSTDSLLVIKNDLFLNAARSTTERVIQSDLFHESNIYFSSLISGLSTLVTRPGLINIDYRDLRTVLKSMGPCTVGFGSCSGTDRATKAALQAIKAAEYSGINIKSAKGGVVNITAGPDFAIDEFEAVGNAVKEILGENAIVVVGTVIDMELTDTIEVTFALSGLQELVVDMSAAEDGFFAEVVRNIEFEPHQASSGLSILSYFGEVIKQKHEDVESKVRIEQTDNSVSLIIEAPNGEVEKIEKTLEEYGQVILGNKTPSQFLPNEIDAKKLELKLEMTSFELRQSEKILFLYKNQNEEYKERLNSLEKQMFELQSVLSKGLASSNQNLELLISKHEQIPSNLLSLLESNKDSELSKDTEQLIELHVRKLYGEKRSGFISLEDLVRNGVYGVAGNSLYNFLSSLINSFPK
tara:strand:- start:1051 stop:2745 length:1695 start_codon:yes stop_codon:yes gene_type:complete